MSPTTLTGDSRRLVRTHEVDVVIVGGRVAGASTALLLAQGGHDVLVVDRAEFPSDTISTHVIARSGMVQLRRLGVLDAVVGTGAPQIRTVEFTSEHGFMSRQLKDRYGIEFLLAPRRYILDAVLQEAAVDAGAQLQAGVAVDDVLRDERGRVVGVVAHDQRGPIEIRARHVVGADGLSSRVARSVGAQPTIVRPGHGAAQYAYYAGDWPAIEHHLADQAFAGVFPTQFGEACIWVCSPEDVARDYRRRHASPGEAFAALLADAAPALAGRLHPSRRRSEVRGMLRMPNYFRQAFGDGWSLVGDAGYHRDAVTGHGISDALRDAELLAAALHEALHEPGSEAGALAAYAETRDRMAKDIFEITCELAQYPEQSTFLELQRRLAAAIDVMAEELDSRPLPRAVSTVA